MSKRIFTKTNIIWLVALALTYLLIELLVQIGVIDPYYEITLVNILIDIILAVGLNLVVGFAGQFSLGHAGFMAIGAYATGIILKEMPNMGGLALSLVVGMALAGVVALIVGIPTLRLKGDYLAIATLGASEIIRIAILNMPDLTNGAVGLSGIPQLIDWRLAFIFMVLSVLLVTNYIRSSAGRATIAVREDEIATESLGINTTKYKIIAFVIGAMTAAVAGAIHASRFGVINPGQFTFARSIDVLIVVVLGGIGSITGSILAAILLGVVNIFLQDFGQLRMILYALVLIGVMLFRPGGLMGNREFKLTRLFKRPQDEPGYPKSQVNDEKGDDN